DVLQADGGTRTASITGAYVALVLAIDQLMREEKLQVSPIVGQIAAVSAGVVGQILMVDLCYQEDSNAQVDMNVIMNEKGEYIELQGTGEGRSFTKEEWREMSDLSQNGIDTLMEIQRQVLKGKAAHILPRPTLIVASENKYKIKELSAMLAPYYQMITMKEAGFNEEIAETGSTFAENALIKAQIIAKATGMAAIADDSGLEVKALHGEPGVYSARFAGEHGNDEKNNALLLEKMKEITDRKARFVSAVALVDPKNGKSVQVQGTCEGRILHKPIGTEGFGYDPLFQLEDGRNFGEISFEEKNQVSHRSRALQKLIKELEKKGNDQGNRYF
ncbi:MAG: RdgB/HAM1 family non-canonical purine NTP pyrophosphatase, partial [Clostridiales bacterium]|nr:RdgB/HAM1 family non-canonical purine NTP pyrophosphatase [Clostridiales bacterium]